MAEKIVSFDLAFSWHNPQPYKALITVKAMAGELGKIMFYPDGAAVPADQGAAPILMHLPISSLAAVLGLLKSCPGLSFEFNNGVAYLTVRNQSAAG